MGRAGGPTLCTEFPQRRGSGFPDHRAKFIKLGKTDRQRLSPDSVSTCLEFSFLALPTRLVLLLWRCIRNPREPVKIQNLRWLISLNFSIVRSVSSEIGPVFFRSTLRERRNPSRGNSYSPERYRFVASPRIAFRDGTIPHPNGYLTKHPELRRRGLLWNGHLHPAFNVIPFLWLLSGRGHLSREEGGVSWRG